MTDTQTTPAIGHVAIRPPPFWSDNPTLWFAQLESQFKLAKITADDTMYSHVVSSLTERMATEVQNILAAPPTSDKYSALKKALLTECL